MYDIIHLYHDKILDKYFIRKGKRILFRIPKWIGRILLA